MKRPGLILMIFVLVINSSNAQTLLDADGISDTYDLINSVLAPGYNVIESPGITVGSCDNHSAFGDHITQVFDDSLDIYVFAFHIHVDEDNDRCINFDRQRNEIKTYDKSPDSLLGVLGETIEFKWKFKLDEGFQPSSSFTHIHQLKSVGSPEDGMPLITLTPRKGTPDKLQLRYAATTSQSTIHEVELEPFKGIWVEATERVTYGEAGIGTYSISLETVHDGTSLFAYSSSSLRMWKTSADFIRPKWGIYRSLNDAASLRDEIVYFANFSIYEEEDVIDPSVNISTSATELNTPTFDISIQFSEDVSGFTKDDIVITNAFVEAGSLSTSDNVTFSATIVPDFTGDVTIDIPIGAAQDAAGNDNEASNQITVVRETTAPTVVIAIDESEPDSVTSDFGITITFSEVVTGFDETDISVENGQVLAGSLSSADSIVFTATIDPSSSVSVNIIVDISAGVAQDIFGNVNEAANELSVPFIVPLTVNNQEEGGLSIYPNPVNNILNIHTDQSYQVIEVAIIEQSGRVIYTNKYSGKDLSLDLSGYNTGVYIIRLKTIEAVLYKNLIIR
ncbi:Ig-like domain-containing protein [Bacteroidota bacterium]